MCTEKYYSKNFAINNVSNLVLIGSIKNRHWNWHQNQYTRRNKKGKNNSFVKTHSIFKSKQAMSAAKCKFLNRTRA